MSLTAGTFDAALAAATVQSADYSALFRAVCQYTPAGAAAREIAIFGDWIPKLNDDHPARHYTYLDVEIRSDNDTDGVVSPHDVYSQVDGKGVDTVQLTAGVPAGLTGKTWYVVLSRPAPAGVHQLRLADKLFRARG